MLAKIEKNQNLIEFRFELTTSELIQFVIMCLILRCFDNNCLVLVFVDNSYHPFIPVVIFFYYYLFKKKPFLKNIILYKSYYNFLASL